jgi:hypothetical protein
MMRQWSHGEGMTFLIGRALISAAVDCRRAGYNEPVPARVLATLSHDHLPVAWRDRDD